MTSRTDVILPKDTWLDVNTATGLPVGTELVIQNKSADPVLIWLGASAPANLTDGYLLDNSNPAIITAGEPKVWALGFGPISVQD